ncbi:MAG TPA: TolC family protein [Gemmatimonadales bacterium]
MHRLPGLTLSFLLYGAAGLAAQGLRPVTRADAVAQALERGPRMAFARADSAAARSDLRAARAFANPTASVSYSKSVPRYHAILDLPLDWPWLRAPRVGSAAAANAAAQYRVALERVLARFDAETTYTRALAFEARARLSRRNSADADSLLRMATVRRDAGDASDMDVRLAAISAGQLENEAADDSLAALGAVLDLQQVMGLAGDSVRVALADTLALAPADSLPAAGTPLGVAAAAADLTAAERALALERAVNLPSPSVQVGVENGDPTGQERGILPTVGITLPLPFFNQNGGAIGRAAAERDRAAAAYALTRRESDAAIAQARRTRDVADAKVGRDAALLTGADSVAAMFRQAYAEGAVSLPEVLEAQRNARESLGRYVDDLAAAHTARDVLRVLTATEDH